MKNQIRIGLLLFILLFINISCEKKSNDQADISYHVVDKEFVLIRDVQTLQESNDEISNYVDSILLGLINAEFISTGEKEFDLDADQIPDIGFDIIDLNLYNPNGLPESFDSLAARVLPISLEILDNTTYGYPDALLMDDLISKNGYWSKNNGVLGTFVNAGQFQGKGERYLGIRLPIENDFKYGWIKINCSQHSDTLRIIDYAYNNIVNSKIKAGQKE